VDQRDLTVIYYTANTLREPLFSAAQKQLLESIGNYPLISVSQKPLDLGRNICVGDIGRSYINIYHQMLTGAKAAETKYVALAEDDVLYCKEHFNTYRPKDDEFAYDMARWSIYSWVDPPIYSLKFRKSNTTLIAPRDLLIEALEERFAKYPDESKIPLSYWGEPGRYESALGVTPRKTIEFTSTCPCVVFSHPDAIGYDIQGKTKRLGQIKAYDIPYWQDAKNFIERFYGTQN
jgi:hypothetical protein